MQLNIVLIVAVTYIQHSPQTQTGHKPSLTVLQSFSTFAPHAPARVSHRSFGAPAGLRFYPQDMAHGARD